MKIPIRKIYNTTRYIANPSPNSLPMSNRVSRFLLALLGILILFMVVLQWGEETVGGEVMIDVKRPEVGELIQEAFVLDAPLTLLAHAVGSVRRAGGDSLSVTAWLVEEGSGDVVWSMGQSSRTALRGTLVEVRDTLNLAPGLYRAYFSTMGTVASDRSVNVLQRVRRRETQWVNDRDAWRFTLSAVGEVVHEIRREDGAWEESIRDRVLARWNTQDEGEAESLELYVPQPTPIRIQLLGKRGSASGLQFELIPLADGGAPFQISAAALAPISGTPMYGTADTTLVLTPGIYRATYLSGAGWSAHPPERAHLWGALITANKQEVSPPAYWSEISPLIDITQVQGNRVREERFEVTDSVWVRLEALGEISPETLMDFATLYDRFDHVVWQQSRENSEHAEGSRNNRRSVAWLHLGPGSYRLRFETDPRHHYEDFESSRRPDHPERWGVALFAVGDAAGRIVPQTTTKAADPATPPSREPFRALLRVQNKQSREVTFTLDRPGRYLIVAQGELSAQSAYDTGGLRMGSDGAVLWQLHEAQTVHAGGAERNRIAQEEMFLGAGTYTLFFQTDDSHAYGDFDNPPTYPELWGIALYPIE